MYDKGVSNFGHKKAQLNELGLSVHNNGAPGRIRTSDRLVRSQVLYPAELLAHNNS